MSAQRLILQFAFAVAVVIGASKESFATLSPIDSISLQAWPGTPDSFNPPGQAGVIVIGLPGEYHLHDGSSWEVGDSIFHPAFGNITSVTESGNQLSYGLDLPTGSDVFNCTNFSYGLGYSSYGELISTAPLVLTATDGSNTAHLSGYAKLVANAPAANAQPFTIDYFNANIGDLVPFSLTYTLYGMTWTPTTSSSDIDFQYTMSGTLDFANAVAPEPMGISFILSAVACTLMFRPRRKTNP